MSGISGRGFVVGLAFILLVLWGIRSALRAWWSA
jgi:hypothetical protein